MKFEAGVAVATRAFVAMLAFAAATPVEAGLPEVVWGRTNATAQSMLGDLQLCQQEALSARPTNPSARPDAAGTWATANAAGYSPLGAAIGMVIGKVIVDSLDKRAAQREYVPRCMHTRGYHALSLSPADRAAADALRTPEATSKWLADFYARPDFASRVAAATMPALPEAQPEPLTYGGVRFNPGELAAASGVVVINGVVLSGKVLHRRTGRLQEDVRLPGFYDGVMAAKEVVHEAVFPTEDPGGVSYWCGPVRVRGHTLHACLRNDGDDTYAVLASKGAPWLATDLDTSGGGDSISDVPCHVVVDNDDQAGAIDFALVLRGLTRTSVVLEALVTEGDDTETMWKATLPLDSAGHATLPFWTHRLTLSAAGKGVSAAFTADGDGAGLPYEPVEE